MEEKVRSVLKLIEEDGDSFAKRAEMYYKKRPELIHFVEESYRGYRALAERYDHISTELQNANNTIASVFPEQVQFALDEEDEEGATRFPKKPPEVPNSNIPTVPKIPTKDLKNLIPSPSKKWQPRKTAKTAATTVVAKSGLSKNKALEEIDKLQKQILSLQTEKEFVKSSYENGLAKYWEIENQIKEMQERVFSLQDEFSEGVVIEDDEARRLMAAAALKSCEDTLAQLQEKQERSAEEARVEFHRIKDAREKFECLKGEFNYDQLGQQNPHARDGTIDVAEALTSLEQEGSSVTHERQELELLREKIKEHFEARSNTSLNVTEMAEKIDELVNKVISLESAISSQNALVKRLRTETDELQTQIRTLEDDKATLIDGSNNLSNKMTEMEEKLHAVQDLNQTFDNQNNNLQSHFTEARCNLDHLSEKLESVKPDEEFELTVPSQKGEEYAAETNWLNELEGEKYPAETNWLNELEGQEYPLNGDDGLKKLLVVKADEELSVTDPLQKEEGSAAENRSQKELKEEQDTSNPGEDSSKADNALSNAAENEAFCRLQAEPDSPSEKDSDLTLQDKDDKHTSSQIVDGLLNSELKEQEPVQEDEPDWKQLFLSGLEDREKVLLTEYTTSLRNYKDIKKKLTEVEKKTRDSNFDTSVQLQELKSANAVKDEEIKSLRQKINLLLKCMDESKDLKDFEASDSQGTSNVSGDLNREPKVGTETTLAAEEDDIKALLIDQPDTMSAIEKKLRMNIDELLEENLDFWLKFSTVFHQIQKFDTGIKDLQDELLKLSEKGKKLEGSSTVRYSLKSDARPIYKHLREIQTELTVWLEQSALLKDELQCRFTSLCNIQEEITTSLKESAEEDEFRFTSYQAAKFQGEVLNMKQENNKVADELQAGLDHVTALQLELEKTLAKLNDEFELSGSKKQLNPQLRHTESRTRIPLRSFIFGVKPKKQKPSIFSCMSPAMNRKYQGLRPGQDM
ncbi:hypothetical protein CJ030_MR8G002359 [Morella rubra]|uniref:NAB domain-containing protein n=1 Tax=Morella rubra TaxID=262757 RepID=A0A6A1UQ39_9ROSI|nr:hypothetical protein CJ030_MR8G002359 [Morella rubra]